MHCALQGSCNAQTLPLVQRYHVGHCRCQVLDSSRRMHTPRCSTELVAPLSNVVLTQLDQLPAPAIAADFCTQHGEVSRVGRLLPQPQETPIAPGMQQQPAPAESQPASAAVNPSQVKAAVLVRQQQQQQQQADAVQPEQAVALQGQRPYKQMAHSSGRRSRKAKARAAAPASAAPPPAAAAAAEAASQSSSVLQETQQGPQKPARSHRRLLPQAPLKFGPCERGGSLKHATAVSKHLSQGKQVLLPAGSGMQVARGVAALASARTLMLGRSSSTGLAFQPTFPAAAAAEVQQEHQQQVHVQEQHQQQHQQQQRQQGLKQQGGRSSGKRPASSDSGIMMFAAGVPEAQLRRFEQSPLIAARYGDSGSLAGAAFARMCQQGFTAVRAAGPDALAVALTAVTLARRKLLGCGLDLAVVPMTEFVDVDSLTGKDGQPSAEFDGDEQQQLEVGPDDDFGRQCVRVTVLHIMRCEPLQPWQLLPWPPAAEQQPAVLWQAEQLDRQQRALLRHQQQQQQNWNAAAHSVGQQPSGTVRQPARPGGSAGLGPFAVSVSLLESSAGPASNGQAGSSKAASGSSIYGSSHSDGASRVWPDNAVEGVTQEAEADMPLQAASYSNGQGMVASQVTSVLLQKQRNGKRHLVAAAHSGNSARQQGPLQQWQ